MTKTSDSPSKIAIKVHELKTWPESFEAMLDDQKRFDARRNDRDFKVGEYLHLREWTPADGIHSSVGDYTGRELFFRIAYILTGSESNKRCGINDGYVVMSIECDRECLKMGSNRIQELQRAKR